MRSGQGEVVTKLKINPLEPIVVPSPKFQDRERERSREEIWVSDLLGIRSAEASEIETLLVNRFKTRSHWVLLFLLLQLLHWFVD